MIAQPDGVTDSAGFRSTVGLETDHGPNVEKE
jgi:hypothetical protein